jgi:deazaflavin-dependent oxidoreductase (nitroreductase family)
LPCSGDVTLQTETLPFQPGRDPSQGQYIRLETIGRKTGRPHQVLVRFTTAGRQIAVFPQTNSRQDWILNIKTNPAVRVHSGTNVYSGAAKVKEIVSLKDPLLSAFTRKYGPQVVKERYWGQRQYVELNLAKVGTVNLEQLIYDDLETAFDGVAENYDRHILGNPINSWLRNVSVTVLKKTFNPGDVVLEIGCGTGTETLNLARTGVTVLACDVSARMLNILNKKASQEGLTKNVITIHCRTPDLEKRVRALGYEHIDGAYSTYGAINTEPQLRNLFYSLRRLLKEDGALVLGVWNKFCLYELVGYILKGKPTLAFARLRNPVPVGKSRFCIASNAYSVSTLHDQLGQFFNLESVYGVVITLPPSNLTRYMPRGRLLGLFKGVDLRLARVFPFNRLGDHFLALYSPRMIDQR